MRINTILYVCLLLLATATAHAQPVSFEKEGVHINVWAYFSIERVQDKSGPLFGSENFKVTLTSLSNKAISIDFKGKTYYPSSFGYALQPYFDRINVYAIQAGVTTTGFKDCDRFSYAVWKEGEPNVKFCEPTGKVVGISSVDISDIYVSGINDLKNKIRELEKDLEDQKKQEQEQVRERAKADSIAKAEELIKSKENIEKSVKAVAEHQKKLQEKYNSESSNELSSRIAEAQAYEAEGDRLNAMGSLYAVDAYKQYQLAQRAFYTTRVQSKMDGISGQIQLAEGLVQLGNVIGDELDALNELIDPTGKTQWSNFNFGYIGNLSSFGDFAPSYSPQSYSLALSYSNMYFNFETRFVQTVLPAQTFNIYRDGWNLIVGESYLDSNGRITSREAKADVLVTALGVGFSIGFNVPFRNMQFYGNYGVDLMLPNDFEVVANNFEYDGATNPVGFPVLRRLTAGANFRIPRSPIGLGVTYNYFSFKGEKELGSIESMRYTGDSREMINGEYHLYENKFDKYSFHNVGFHLFWLLDWRYK